MPSQDSQRHLNVVHNFINRIRTLPQQAGTRLIRGYQKTISPDHSRVGLFLFPRGFCRFYPSCSEYGRQAILRYGIIRTLPKIIWRLLRCNPFSLGGNDPV